MSILAAVGWVIGIHAAFLWLLLALTTLREEMQRDVVAWVFCQLAAYGLGLFVLLRRYGKTSRIRDFLGVRQSHWLFYGLAAIIGATATIPASALLGLIERRWPLDEGELSFSNLFYNSAGYQQVMIAVGVVLLAPLIEEALFRGAIFVPLRKQYDRWTVIAVTALLFALVHQTPQRLPPLFLMGLLMGYLRASSGTMGVTIVAHAAFNAVPMSQMFLLGPEAENDDVSDIVLIATSVGCALAIAAFHWLAANSRRAAVARELDL